MLGSGLNKQDLGYRVVIRRKINELPQYADILGELIDLTDEAATVRTASGVVRVPLAEIHRAKRVPPRAHRRAAEIAALELAAARAWPAPVSERLGDWWLRAAEDFTGRANAALPVGDPGVPLPAALDAVAAFYLRVGQQPQIDVPIPLAQPVAVAAAKAGWQVSCSVLVQTAELGELIAATPDGTRVTLADQPGEAGLALIADRRGTLPPAALHVLTAVDQLTFAEYAEHGTLLAHARGTVTDGWLGLFVVETVPAARRRGLAQEVIGRLARWAADRGATRAFLQVESTNETAIALYARLGFVTHHTYTRFALAT